MISTEAAILKAIFPPAGAIPLNRVDDLGKIQAHISAIIDLSTGYRPVASAPRVSDPTESNHLTARIVGLRESAEGMSLSWSEIAARIGGLTDAACRKRYAAYCARREADELRREGYAALSGENQESEKVATRGCKNPKIPHTEDEFIDSRRAGGAKYSGIQAELVARGIACTVDDVIARHHSYREKREREAVGKKPHNAPSSREEAAQRVEPKAPVTTPEQTGPDPSRESMPAQKAIGRADLDAKIWQLHKAGKTPEQISDELCAEGLYYSEESVRVRLISQGAEL